jgi:hypothetical protein
MDPKLAPIRKGLLEFLVLKIVGARSVYVPDILRRLAGTEFATQEGTLYPCSASCAGKTSSSTSGRNPTRARHASTTG